ncbi:MAG TPA: 1-hydroxycarotenoid 3,4-desaturase CrtD, partial [Cytophagales bacterium]|nr:1-hydroxycarotenoid 3,4-desaturase CrtD [Cytophagales bacterium]
PEWVDELYLKAGKRPSDYYTYKKLEVLTHYFYEDGTTFRSYAKPELFAEELTRQGIDASKLQAYLKKVAFIYDATAPIFLKSSLHRWRSYLNLGVLGSIFKLPWIKGLQSMDHMNKAYFTDPRLQQYFNRMATYNGSDPYKAPGTLNLIGHVEHGIGAYYPSGGMYAITQGLYQLALDLGVEFHFGTYVEEIIVAQQGSRNKALGLKAAGHIHKFDRIVSNMDIFYTYRKLLPHVQAPEKLLSQEKSSSALIFYWGVKGQFAQLGLHNIFFTEDYRAEFAAIFESRKIHDDPTIYINITCKETPSDAPEGCENWFVMINVPHDSGQDWSQLKKDARAHIMAKLNRMLKTDLASLIVVEDTLEPITIEQRTSSYKGALYGNASNNKMAAFLRHANFSSKIDQLYFCGGSVHPGGGIPLAIQSGKIVADLIS